MSSQQIVGNGLVVLTTVLAWLFVVLYHLSSPWWRSEAGRNLMSMMAVIAAVLSLSAVRIVIGADSDTPWFIWLRVLTFAATPLVIGWRVWMLWRVQFRGRRWAEIRGRRRGVRRTP